MGDNPWDIEEPIDDGSQQNNNAFTQLRDAYGRQQKDIKAKEKELEELRTFKSEAVQGQRKLVAENHLRELGLPPQTAALFVLANQEAEPTKEAVARFALDHGLLAAQQTEQANQQAQQQAQPGQEQAAQAAQTFQSQAQQQVQQPQGFVPVTVGGAGPAVNTLPHEKYRELLKTNPQEAIRAVAEGRVEGMLTSI